MRLQDKVVRRLGLLASLFILAGAAPKVISGQTTARYNHSTTLLPNGDIVIIGGENAPDTFIGAAASVEIFVSTADFHYNANPSACGASLVRSSHTATVLPNGKILITGGVGAGPAVLNTGVVYNPSTNACETPGNTMNATRVHHTATLLANGKVLVAGGDTDLAGTVTTSVDIFDPTTGLFSAAQPMLSARAGHTAAILPNNQVYIAGGYSSLTSFLNVTELYNSQLNQWLPGPTLIQSRAFHTATMMGNGNIVLAGGFNAFNNKASKGYLESVEVYNPFSNSMMPPAPPMAERRMYHTGNLEPDGSIFIHGGLGNITTSYFLGNYAFVAGSTMGATAGAAITQGIISNASNILVPAVWTLAVPASGMIVSGQATYSFHPSVAVPHPVTLGDATIDLDFTFSNEFSSLNGTPVTCDIQANCGKVNRNLPLLPPAGTINFIPQTVASKAPPPLAAGSNVTFAPDPCPAGTSCALSGGTMNVTIDIPFNKWELGGTVIQGNATILSANISNTVQNYTIAFNGGNATGAGNFSGGAITADAQGNAHYVRTVAFTGLSGNFTNNSGGGIASGLSTAGQLVTGLQLLVSYTVSPIDLSNVAFNTDITTISINTMVFADQERYDPSANTWSFGPRAYSTFNHSTVLTPNGDTFIFGGRTCNNLGACSTYLPEFGPGVYIPQKTIWSTDAALNQNRSNHTATVLADGRVLAAGGVSGQTTLTSAELYNPASPGWALTGFMRTPRAGHTANLLPDGTVLVAGGYVSSASTGATNLTEIYYPESGQWVPTGPMVSSRQAQTATLLPNGDLLVAGGFANGVYLNSSEVYVATAAKWMPVASMTNPRSDHTATLLQNGLVLVAGGTNAGGPTATVEAFNPATMQWSAMTAMPAVGGRALNGRFGHTATLLRDGRVLVVGGDDSLGEIAAAVIYDPNGGGGGTWKATTALGLTGSGLGNDLGRPRLRHTAILAPDGKVLIIGGVTATNSSLTTIEGFDVDVSSWQNQGVMNTARGYHASVLLTKGRVLNIGGSPAPNSTTDSCESDYYGPARDVRTPSSSFSRIPSIVAVDTGTFDRGTSLTITGNHFKGGGEASGGGVASMNSSFNTPRVYLQAADSRSGFMEDLSTTVYTSINANWSNVDSSITLAMPPTVGQLPYGWYHLRVAANAQFSDASVVQAGPFRPTGVPSTPSGVQTGPLSVLWSWNAAAGCPTPGVCEGYHVYSATNSVFLSTVSATCAGGVCQYLQTGIPAGGVASVRVAAYNISGDGSPAVSSNAITAASLAIASVLGNALDVSSIAWTWSSIPSAVSYRVFSRSSGTLLGVVPSNSFVETGLSTNTAQSVTVQAFDGSQFGPLTASPTVYTLAAVPGIAAPPFLSLSTGGFVTQWIGTNPPGTQYQVTVATGASTPPILTATLSGVSYTLTNQTPNSPFMVKAAGVNGNGILSAAITMANTYTLANPPSNLAIVSNTPNALTISWDANSNPNYTLYQVTDSSDNFVASISTPIPFSSNFTGLGTPITGLLTSVLYTVHVTARNQNLIEAAPASISTVTFNGGGPPGSLAAIIDPAKNTLMTGTIGSGRSISLSFIPNTFPDQITVFVSSRANIPTCGPMNAAISITTLPGEQPTHPFTLSLSYSPAEVAGLDVSQLAIVRYDPGSNSCVPLRTSVNAAQNTLYAQVNHLSDFQIQLITPQAGLGNARVFPNPVYTRNQGFMTFDRLMSGTRVRIYTIRGEELFDGTANGSGILTWPVTNKTNRAVGSGVYIAVVESNGQKQTMKLAVIR